MLCKEFSLISRYFDRIKTLRFDVENGIGDDCALLNIPEEKTLAISTDTLVCGRHFLPDVSPSDLAYKAIAVNISDLAAMGATPVWLTLALTLPSVDETWLKAFSDMLFEQLYSYNMQLIGGDTTCGPLSITLTVYGFVPVGCALKRSGAKPGDLIYVTGTLGDSAAGLAILQHRLTVTDTNDATYLINRHLRPTPRIFHGQALLKFASSAIDLSDGLLSDLEHIMKTCKVGACIHLDAFPFSTAMIRHVEPNQAVYWACSGGEDYELLFTISELHRSKLDAILGHLSIPFTCIGQILLESEGLQFVKSGSSVIINWNRYDHFE